MLSREQNDLLTRTDAGTPGGALLRSYWQPVATEEEMAPGKPPMPVRILGEDLVLFRDPEGRLGLIGLNCPHRGTDLSYGRVENGGLRCLYHGWLFDIKGRCLEQPAERADSGFKDKIRHTAYPVQEKGGAIWAWLGEGEAPLIPDYAFLAAPKAQRIVFRVVQDCNWLQGMEGSIDPSHTSFLHRITPRAVRAATDDSPDPDHAGYFAEDICPDLEIEKTRFGLRICALRGLAKGERYLRVTNYLFPNGAAIVGAETAQNAGGYSGRCYVPIDDGRHCRFEFLYVTDAPIDVARFRARRADEIGPDSRHVRNAANRYQQDRGEMATQTFAGMGKYFPAHDAFAIETQGTIQDRTREHLGRTDMAVIEMRKSLLEAIRTMAEGGTAPCVVRDPRENDFPELMVFGDFIASGMSGPEYCRQRLVRREAAAE